jgi:hypothetical protein
MYSDSVYKEEETIAIVGGSKNLYLYLDMPKLNYADHSVKKLTVL